MVENFDEWFHDILEKANITDSRYPIKGMAIWMPYGFQIRKHTMNIIKKLLDEDHEEVLFPMLIPETELAKEGIHVKGFEDEVYWITKGGQTELNEQLALRPTVKLRCILCMHYGSGHTLTFQSNIIKS